LPEKLTELECNHNLLNYLPKLPETLELLYCYYNQLTSLPNLPETLQVLYCHINQLTSLPKLPEILKELYCKNNKLTCLPNLPKILYYFIFNNNPIYKIIGDNDLNIVRHEIERINCFRELYYCIKYKNKFREWLWVKVREPLVMKLYNPEYLMNNLKDEETDLDEVLKGW
jgi:Leucine-rich repeat (LRR) protein